MKPLLTIVVTGMLGISGIYAPTITNTFDTGNVTPSCNYCWIHV